MLGWILNTTTAGDIGEVRLPLGLRLSLLKGALMSYFTESVVLKTELAKTAKMCPGYNEGIAYYAIPRLKGGYNIAELSGSFWTQGETSSNCRFKVLKAVETTAEAEEIIRTHNGKLRSQPKPQPQP